MNSRLFGLVGAVTAVALAAGCKKDPTGDLAGKPSLISFAPAPLPLNEGASGNIAVQVLDQSLSPLKSTISFSSTATGVATVALASVAPDPTGTITTLTVTALTPGPAYIKVSALGLTDSARVNVLPLLFAGALSTKTPAGGAEMTIKATQFLKFNPTTASVTYGGASGVAAPINVASSESLVVVAPFSGAAPLSIAGISVTYIPGREVTLNTKDTVTQTGDVYALADTSFATAPTLTLPATGKSLSIISDVGPANNSHCAEVVLGFGSSGPCMIYQFTVAAPTSLTFSTNWTPGGALSPDIDIYACPAPQSSPTDLNKCFEEGGSGATGAKPQSFTYTFPAGTHYFVVEIFDNSTATKNIISTITHN